MATLKTLEIDTLKLRSLQISAKDNVFYPKDFHLYTNKDGTTYWSTGVTGIQFINLSTTVSTNQVDNKNRFKNITDEVFSTLFGFSTFAYNVSTYEVTLKYTDEQITKVKSEITSYVANTYQTQVTANKMFKLLQTTVTTNNDIITASVSSLSTLVDKIDFKYENQSTILQSTVIQGMSTTTGSTIAQIFIDEQKRHDIFQMALINNTIFLEAQISSLSTTTGYRLDIIEGSDYLAQIQSTQAKLVLDIQNEAEAVRLSSMYYTEEQLSQVYPALNVISKSVADLEKTMFKNINIVNSTISNLSSNTSTSFKNLSLSQDSTNKYLIENLSTLITSGVTSEVLNTFKQLEGYSSRIVTSTTTSLNTAFTNATNILTTSSQNILNNITTTTFENFASSLYRSTLSTVLVNISTSLTGRISDIFQSFSTTISTLNSTNAANFSTYMQSNVDKISTLATNNLIEMSSLFRTQYLTAPSIIMNSVDNIRYLHNILAPDGTTNIVAGLVELDLTKYNNFYLLVSDINSDVFYGLTYSTTKEEMSKDVTLQIDIMSSYTNKYTTLDTAIVSQWTNNPKIFNQGPTQLHNKPAYPQIFISTFLGAQIVQMRLNNNKLYIKDIITIPYIYTNMSLNQILLDSNLSVADPRLATSTFVYSGTRMPVSWKTNDLNVEVGLKFEGTDINGKKIERWAGPYKSSDQLATVIVPDCVPIATYTSIYLGIYPPQGLLYAPASGNIRSQNQMFDTVYLDKPINVFTPTINSKITIYNPGDVDKVLEVSELQINTKNNNNILGPNVNDYVQIVSTSSRPYQGDYASWKITNMFDGNPNTAFRGGRDINTIDKNAYVALDLKSKEAVNLSANSQIISTINIIGSSNNDTRYSITGMMMKVENRNTPGVADGLFYKNITLNSYTPNTITLY